MTRAGRIKLALKARRKGAKYARTILQEAHRADLPPALALALVEQESNFQNVFGHDPTIFVGAGKVTKAKYLAYKRQRGAGGRGGMQGVGLTQLTWYELQDAADALGGCWKPRYQLRVAFLHMRALIREFGKQDGIRRYNGSGDAAQRYANEVIVKQRRWHEKLF